MLSLDSAYKKKLNAERESISTLGQTQTDSAIADSGMVLQNDQEVNEQKVLNAERDKTGSEPLDSTGLGQTQSANSITDSGNGHNVEEQNVFRFADKGENELETPNSTVLGSVLTLGQTQIDNAMGDSGMDLQNDQDVNDQNVFIAERVKSGSEPLDSTGLGQAQIGNTITDSGNGHNAEEQNVFRFSDKEEILGSISTLGQTQIDNAVGDSGMDLQNDKDVNEQNVFIAQREKTGSEPLDSTGLVQTQIGNSITDSGNGHNAEEQNAFRFADEENESQTPNLTILGPISTVGQTQTGSTMGDSGMDLQNYQNVNEQNVFIAEREKTGSEPLDSTKFGQNKIGNSVTDSGNGHNAEEQNVLHFVDKEENESETPNLTILGSIYTLGQTQIDKTMDDSGMNLQSDQDAKENMKNPAEGIEIEETGNLLIQFQAVEAHITGISIDLECPMIEKPDSSLDSEMNGSTNNDEIGKVIDNVEMNRGSYLTGSSTTLRQEVQKVDETDFKITDVDTNLPEDNIEPLFLPPSGSECLKKDIIFADGNVSESFVVNENLRENKTDQACDMRDEGGAEQIAKIATVVSMDLDGWQQFDVDESNSSVSNVASSAQNIELWEQLLDNGFDGIENDTRAPSALHITECGGLESLLNQEKGFDLASPGNPFIDGIDRLSNFSDTDAFFFHEHPSNDIGSHSLKLPKALKFGVTDRSEDCAADLPQNSLDFPANQLSQTGSKPQMHRRDPSFCDLQVSPLDSTKSFEAPSVVSPMDPDANQLVEASKPTYQMGGNLNNPIVNGDKWEANFDLMVPPTHEITRSLSKSWSFPRLVSDPVSDQSSFSTKEGAVSPQTASSGLSPKISSLMKNVVSKVYSSPTDAPQGMSPNVSQKQKSIWAQCFCW